MSTVVGAARTGPIEPCTISAQTRSSARNYARQTVKGSILSLKSLFARVHTSPVIVLGNQKSGTSAIAHLLADYGELSKTVDIRPLWPPTGIEIMRKRIAFADVVRHHRAYFSTELIKEPMMTFFADQVLEAFPKGRFVFVVRDPRDNIRSLLNRRGIPGNLREIEERFIPRSPQHRVVVDPTIWGGIDENYVGVLAHRWNKAIDNYLQFSERMTLVKYEDFVADKMAVISRLARQFDISQRGQIAGKLDIQYQPPGNQEISWQAFFGADNLERIERICGSRMKELGYS
jgi:hypothetical protein